MLRLCCAQPPRPAGCPRVAPLPSAPRSPTRPPSCPAGGRRGCCIKNPTLLHYSNFTSSRRLQVETGSQALVALAVLRSKSISLQFGCSVIRRHCKAISAGATKRGLLDARKNRQSKEGETRDFIRIKCRIILLSLKTLTTETLH